MDHTTNTSAVRDLNDRLRCTGAGGRTMMTSGIAALDDESRMPVLEAVATFDAFSNANDPYAEHGCAVVEVGDITVLWKIDYFDAAMQFGSPDPADPAMTCRVLTIMLADEY